MSKRRKATPNSASCFISKFKIENCKLDELVLNLFQDAKRIVKMEANAYINLLFYMIF